MVLASFAGYVVLAVGVLLGVWLAWTLLGTEGAFEEGGSRVSTTWSFTVLLLGLPAASLGGGVAAILGRPAGRGAAVNAVRLLAGLVLVLGIASGVWQLKRSVPTAEPATPVSREMTLAEAGQHAAQPTWYAMLLPWTGALGVLFGGAVVTRRLEPTS